VTPSPAGARLIQSFEKCARAVPDRPGWFAAYFATPDEQARGIATICWGTTGPDVRIGMVWSQSQGDERFARDLAAFGVGVDHELNGAPTTQAQFDAMTSLAYDVGLGNEQHSTLLALHRAGDYAGAADQFLRWDHQGAGVLPGLEARRTVERAVYLGLDVPQYPILAPPGVG
jgi:lysozyme